MHSIKSLHFFFSNYKALEFDHATELRAAGELGNINVFFPFLIYKVDMKIDFWCCLVMGLHRKLLSEHQAPVHEAGTLDIW